MPFFGGRREPESEVAAPPPAPEVHEGEHHQKKHGFFSRGRDTSPTPSQRTSATTNSSVSSNAAGDQHGHSIFRRSTDASGRRSLLTKFGAGAGDAAMDPSIVQARERVMSAEAAEREADRALESARQSVREAREHVRKLEEEAREEARRAKIKQYHAREVSKRGKALGRHGEI